MDELLCIICSADCSQDNIVHCEVCQMHICPSFSPSTGVKCIRFAEAICDQLNIMPDDEKLHMFLSNYEKLDYVEKTVLYRAINDAHTHGVYAVAHPNDGTHVRMCISAINISLDNRNLITAMIAPLLMENLIL